MPDHLHVLNTFIWRYHNLPSDYRASCDDLSLFGS
ncbi:hypothetical protein SLH49_11925 [Cognatiyoonia sp. IB215446]|nr:hypothetical protein [Cognatiyoonia sp. IB215446]MDX8348689.1 hypothetical protein [Cognatiyoonia sp. IB215446]